MCGIIAIISRECKYPSSIIKKSLKTLENRGYDSAGAYVNNNIIKHIKDGCVDACIEELPDELKGISLAHVRWSTHGIVNKQNAHPHTSFDEKLVLVHNGVFMNYLELKNPKISYKSETDTEVFLNHVACLDGNILENLITSSTQFNGNWAVALLDKYNSNSIYISRKNVSLLIGYNNDIVIIGSEKSTFSSICKNYVVVPNNSCIEVFMKNNQFYVNHEKKVYPLREFNSNYQFTTEQEKKVSIESYSHWMEKEIMEQMYISKIFTEKKNNPKAINLLNRAKHVLLLACGSSLNACGYFSNILRSKYETVQTLDAGEFDVSYVCKDMIVIIVSQSGETMDCFIALSKIKCDTISIVNVEKSLIDRNTTFGIYTHADKEVAVAATKSFTNQIICMHRIYNDLCNESFINLSRFRTNIPKLKLMAMNYANKYKNCKQLFIISSNNGFYFAREAALKLKEISLIHAEAYLSSSLKHGTLSLVNDVPSIVINFNNIKKGNIVSSEISSKKGDVLLISSRKTSSSEDVIIEDENELIYYLRVIVFFQWLSYFIALKKKNKSR